MVRQNLKTACLYYILINRYVFSWMLFFRCFCTLCTAPLALKSHGIFSGKKLTSHPSVDKQLKEAGNSVFSSSLAVTFLRGFLEISLSCFWLLSIFDIVYNGTGLHVIWNIVCYQLNGSHHPCHLVLCQLCTSHKPGFAHNGNPWLHLTWHLS